MTKIFVIEAPNEMTSETVKKVEKRLKKLFKKNKIYATPIILSGGLRASILDTSEY